jgi:hypothetical protein
VNIVIPALIGLIIVRVLVGRAERSVDAAFVDEWARAHALDLTSDNRPMVHWYLRNARLLRTWGALAGLFLPNLVDAAFGWKALEQAQPFWAFFGYLVGALYAELALVRKVDGERRVATLVPREVADYLPGRLVVAPRAVAATVVLGAGVLLAMPFDSGVSGSPPSRASVLAVAGLAVVLGLGLARIERWVVQRPQPFAAPDLLRADDAIRSQSVHSVAGSGLAMLLLLLGGICFGFAATDIQLLRWTMWLPGLACFYGSIHVCLYYGHRAWRVRRSVAGPAAA